MWPKQPEDLHNLPEDQPELKKVSIAAATATDKSDGDITYIFERFSSWNLFWRRWTREYLPSLQQRQKWNEPRRNVVVGDIVLVLDEKTPRSSWPLARVLEVYANKRDGFVRSAKLKTATTVMVRPIDKMVLLER